MDTHPNGGASVLYLQQKDIDMLSPHQQNLLAEEFLKVYIFHYIKKVSNYFYTLQILFSSLLVGVQ